MMIAVSSCTIKPHARRETQSVGNTSTLMAFSGPEAAVLVWYGHLLMSACESPKALQDMVV